MAQSEWKFTEAQRDSVCKGELCPKCLDTNVQRTGSAPDLMRMNYRYECQQPDCREGWEGY